MRFLLAYIKSARRADWAELKASCSVGNGPPDAEATTALHCFLAIERGKSKRLPVCTCSKVDFFVVSGKCSFP